MKMTLFGNRVFSDNQVKMRSLSWFLIQRGNLDTDIDTGMVRTPCDHKGRGWGETSTNQGIPKLACQHITRRWIRV